MLSPVLGDAEIVVVLVLLDPDFVVLFLPVAACHLVLTVILTLLVKLLRYPLT